MLFSDIYTSFVDVDEDLNIDSKVEFLKKNTSPIESVYAFWKATFNYQRNLLMKGADGIHKYVECYPILSLTEHAKTLVSYTSSFDTPIHRFILDGIRYVIRA